MKKLFGSRLLAVMLVLTACVSGRVPAWSQAERSDASARPAERQTEQTAKADGAAEVDENEAYEHSAMVRKLGGVLGMKTETAAVVFEWANFAVLGLALVFVMVKTLPKTFRGRSSAIQKDLSDARTATEAASLRLNSVEDRLSHLDAQIAEMRAQSEKDSAADGARIKAQVEDEKKKIVAAAEQEIAAASVHAQRQLQRYAAELAIEQAAKKLEISAETDRLLVQEFARRLGTDGAN